MVPDILSHNRIIYRRGPNLGYYHLPQSMRSRRDPGGKRQSRDLDRTLADKDEQVKDKTRFTIDNCRNRSPSRHEFVAWKLEYVKSSRGYSEKHDGFHSSDINLGSGCTPAEMDRLIRKITGISTVIHSSRDMATW
ncbi:hypothetical protein EMPG_11886 [Blastomyces silverae]|uniref:Uncharacterized protein n=1 Tax=Blastomyces silverae TaxID=2060906 RepID=A0A0H1BNP6_9EURO|nr:hypothetical protein EMPG_11886 [Blastomyces silverae]